MAKTTKTENSSEYELLQSYLDNLANPPRDFKRGQIVKGKIIKIKQGQLIVDIGGRTEGVVAGKEMKLDGEKFEKKEGEEVLVYVIKPENIKGQIELSIRRTGMARKWHDLFGAKESSGSIEVTVVEANTGGVIVDIPGGLRGFVPSSQLNPARIAAAGAVDDKKEANQQMQNKMANLIGEKLEVVVMEIDKEKNRVILSEKNVNAEFNPEQVQKTIQNLKPGDTFKGIVTGVVPFGLFVSAEGVEGLVHLSEISWDKVTNPADFYQVGAQVDVQVIGVDNDGKRIAYSIKRLLPDPWDEIIKKYQIGQIIKGEITKVVDYGAFVRIEDGLNGLIHISELSNKLVKSPSEIVKEGEVREVKIISMSKGDRHLGLSIKQLDTEGVVTKGKKTKKEAPAAGTLGEIAPEMARLGEILGEEAA